MGKIPLAVKFVFKSKLLNKLRTLNILILYHTKMEKH